MVGNLKKNSEGFTIIEVLIVLAIAGLIMLIVFLAVPALNRNSHNTARRTDVGRVGSSATEFISNNNGRLPVAADSGTIESAAGQLSQYPATGYLTVVTGGTPAPVTAIDTMTLVTGVKCNTAPGAAAGSVTADTTRSLAIQYAVENASGTTSVCQQV